MTATGVVDPAAGLVQALLVGGATLLGLLVGSFLNVVVGRVPAGESVVHPPSRCPGCGHAIRPRDNVPVLSWLLLRGRCRDCGRPISVRYPLVEAGTAVAFGAVAAWAGPTPWLGALLVLAAASVALALIDLDVHRLPDAVVAPATVLSLVGLVVAQLVGDVPGHSLVRALVGGVVLLVVYLAIALAKPGGMGLGDVKLAGLLGLHLGYVGWGALVVGWFAAFVLGGVYAVVLLLLRRVGRGAGIPFGPWMLAGAWVGLVCGERLFAGYVALL